MSLAVLELNDVALTIRSDSGKLYTEPGFARLTKAGLEFGEAARRTAWREPQSGYNQYWHQLGETPLLVKSKWARHFADIAYGQLKQLLEAVGGVDECILAIPGSFSNQQLALLLGMLNALSVKTIGVVDSALAARAHGQSPSIYLDLHQHHTVVSALAIKDRALEVVQQELIPDLGMARLYNLLAQAISRQLIETSRFDPLHDPATEQWIFDQLPGWLGQLQWQQELALTLATPMGEQPFKVRRGDFASLVRERFKVLDSFLDTWREHPVVLSYAGAPFAELAFVDRSVEVNGATTCVDNCLTYLRPDILQQSALQRLKAMGIVGAPRPAEDRQPTALFLLHEHQALALDEPVSIVPGQGKVTLSRGIDNSAALVVVQQGVGFQILLRADDVEIVLPDTPKAGDVIWIAGTSLPLIEVCDG